MGDPTTKLVARYLGYAFAGADVVLSLDAAGCVSEALGACRSLLGVGPEALLGERWVDSFAADDVIFLETMAAGLAVNARVGPVRVALVERPGLHGARHVAVSAFRNGLADGLMQIGLSAATAPSAGASLAPGAVVDAAAAAEHLGSILETACARGDRVSFGVIDVPGLEGAESLTYADRARLDQELGARLRLGSYRGESAARLGDSTFALLAADEGQFIEVVKQLETTAAGFGVDLGAHYRSTRLPTLANAKVAMSTLRYAIDMVCDEGEAAGALSLSQAVQQTVARSSAFSEMVRGGAFELAFQPIVDMASGRVHHYEALARFSGDESPADTVRLAEELGLVATLDYEVLAKSVAALAAHADPDLRVAVNVSALSLAAGGYADEVAARLGASGVAPGRLLVELTETAPLADLSGACTELERLRALGMQVCIDDVGSGSASLNYLRMLTFDYLKLDGAFVRDAERCTRTRPIIRGLAAMSRELGAALIAEHVETAAVAALLQADGVRLGQGWLYGRPRDLPGPGSGRRQIGAGIWSH